MSAPPFAPRFEVRLSGVTLAADLSGQVRALSVETDLDLAGSFTLTLHNPDNQLLDSALFDLGKTVEIHLGYGPDLVPAFLGEVAAIEPSFPADGAPTVTVTGYDKSYRMRNSQLGARSYTGVNDSLIAAQIAAENGLIPVVQPAPFLAKRLQVDSDMAFLRNCAAQYFFDVYVEWDRLHFHFPTPQTAAHVLEWGRNLSSFNPRISAAGLAGVQEVRAYDQELAQALTVTVLAMDLDPDNLVERLGSQAAQLLMSLVRKGVRNEPIGNPVHALAVAKAMLSNLLEGMYEGSGSCIGIPGLSAGQYVEIAGIGKRFGGTYRMRKVTHRIDDGGFRTDFSITARGHTSLLGMLRRKLNEEAPPSGGAPVFGVLVAEVTANDETKAPEPAALTGRVEICYPGLTGNEVRQWAEVARPMAGAGAGFFTLPEVGDQVLVAFAGGKLSHPYVLGALWNASSRPPATNADGSNRTTMLRSRTGHELTFDDAKGGGSLSLTAAGDLVIKASGKITIEAAGGSTGLSLTQGGVDVT